MLNDRSELILVDGDVPIVTTGEVESYDIELPIGPDGRIYFFMEAPKAQNGDDLSLFPNETHGDCFILQVTEDGEELLVMDEDLTVLEVIA